MVATTHKNYDKYISDTKTVRDCLEGTNAIVSNAKRYIPKPAGMEETEYLDYVKRPSFDNITGRILDTFTGAVFSKDATIEIPSILEKYMEDIDLNDNTDVDIAKKCFKEVFTTGRVGILVDINNTKYLGQVPLTVSETLGIRPYLAVYPNESIINWRVQSNTLVLVVLKEIVEEWTTKYECTDVEQYRVLEIDETGYYKQSLIKQYKDNKSQLNEQIIFEIYPTQNGKKLKYIPFYSCNPFNMDIEPVKPPLYDMADANLSMHRLKTELYNALHFTVPTPYGVGIQDTDDLTITLGSSTFQTFPNPDAELKYLEFTGTGLTHFKDEIKDCKLTMGTLGAEFLRDNTSKAEATETVAMRTAGDRATLMSIAETINRLISKVLTEMALWLKSSEQCNYMLNKDYDLTSIDANLIKILIDGVEMNRIPMKVLHHNLMQNELIPDDIDFEEYQQLLEVQGANDMIMPLPTTQQNNDNIGEDKQPKQDDKTLIENIKLRLGL